MKDRAAEKAADEYVKHIEKVSPGSTKEPDRNGVSHTFKNYKFALNRFLSDSDNRK